MASRKKYRKDGTRAQGRKKSDEPILEDHHGPRSERKELGILSLMAIIVIGTLSIIGLYVLFTPMAPVPTNEVSSATVPSENNSQTDAFNRDVDIGQPTSEPWSHPDHPEPIQVDSLKAELQELAVHLEQSFPNSPDALDNVANIYFNLNKYEEAESSWNRCLEMDALKAQYFLNYVRFLTDSNQIEKAIDILVLAHGKKIKSKQTLDELARLQEREGNIDDAARTILESIDVAPEAGDAHFLAGRIFSKNRKLSEAETYLRKALQLGEDEETVLSVLVTVLARLGKRDEAADVNRKLQALKIKSIAMRENAPQPFHELSRESWRPAAHHSFLRAANLETSQSEKIRYLLRCVQLIPDDTMSLTRLSKAFTQAKRLEDALKVQEALVKTHPESASHFRNLAGMTFQTRDVKKTEAILRDGIDRHPNDESLAVALSQLLLTQKRFQDAIGIAGVWANKSQNFEIHMTLGKAYQATGRMSESAAAFERAKELQHTQQMTTIRENQGQP